MTKIKPGYWGLQIGLALVLLFTLVLPANAQGGITLTVDRLESDKGGAIKAYVTVRDENGVPIPGLVPANFTIVEDQKTSFPPTQVTTQVNPSAKLAIALVIDLSNTMRGKALDEAKAASTKLLEALLNEANDSDQAAFFGINGPVNVDDLAVNEEGKREVKFTNDRNKILNVINAIESDQTSRPTPLYDALFRVIKITARQQAPRAIVVITDGLDVVSKLKVDDPIAEANRNNIPIFPIGFSTSDVNDDYLSRLAVRTGGTYNRAREAKNFTEIFQQTLSRLSEQYVLSYQSRLTPDAQPHAVIIRVDTPKGKPFGEAIFRFPDLPTSVPTTPPTSQPVAGQTPSSSVLAPVATAPPAPPVTVAPTPTPTPQTIQAKMMGFLTNKQNLPYLIGLIALLVLLLALIIFLILRRSRREVAPEEGAAGYGSGAYASEEPRTVEGQALSPTAGPGEPGFGSTTPSPYPSTEVGPGQTPQGFPPPPQQQWPQQQYPPQGQFPQPFGGQQSPQTVILQKSPQPPPVLAMLVNRRQPQQRFDLTASADIGRATTNNISLQNTTISRQHAKIKEEKGEFRVFDLGSANGTFVNGTRVTDPAVLKDGDVVKFGELEFLFKRLV